MFLFLSAIYRRLNFFEVGSRVFFLAHKSVGTDENRTRTEKATHKIKDTIGVKSKKAEEEVTKTAKEAGDQASHLKDEAKARAEYLKQKATEEAEEASGKA